MTTDPNCTAVTVLVGEILKCVAAGPNETVVLTDEIRLRALLARNLFRPVETFDEEAIHTLEPGTVTGAIDAYSLENHNREKVEAIVDRLDGLGIPTLRHGSAVGFEPFAAINALCDRVRALTETLDSLDPT